MEIGFRRDVYVASNILNAIEVAAREVYKRRMGKGEKIYERKETRCEVDPIVHFEHSH